MKTRETLIVQQLKSFGKQMSPPNQRRMSSLNKGLKIQEQYSSSPNNKKPVNVNQPLKRLKTQNMCKQKVADHYIKSLNRKYTRRGTIKEKDFDDDSLENEIKNDMSEQPEKHSPDPPDPDSSQVSPGLGSKLSSMDTSRRRRTTLVFTYNKQATKRHKDQASVLYPESKLVCFWEGLMTSILLFTCIYTPYQVAFSP